MAVEIREIKYPYKSNDFLLLPYKIYKADSCWVAPLLIAEKDLLNRDKHPFFNHADVSFFVAYKNNEPAGRIAAIINRNHNSFHNEQVCFFGFFECVDDQEVAGRLFEKVYEYGEKFGCRIIRGPMSYSTNEQCGLLVSGFDIPPAIMMNHNPRYYIGLIENAGFVKAMDLLAWRVLQDNFSVRLLELADRFEKRHQIKIRSLDMKNFWRDVDIVKGIYNQAWEKNWGFVPMTDEEFMHTAKDMKLICDPDLVLIAEAYGKDVGFAMALPDINLALRHINGRLFPFGIFKLLLHKKDINKIRTLTLGVVSEFRQKGIDLILYTRLFKNGTAKGYNGGEFSWILENNTMMNEALKKMGCNLAKVYRVYEKIR